MDTSTPDDNAGTPTADATKPTPSSADERTPVPNSSDSADTRPDQTAVRIRAEDLLQRKIAAYHEAGHALVALSLEFVVTGAEIVKKGESNWVGVCKVLPEGFEHLWDRELERAIVSLAGCCSCMLCLRDCVDLRLAKEFLEVNQDDKGAASQCIAVARTNKYWKGDIDWCLETSAKVVEFLRDEIKVLGEHLFVKLQLSRQEILDLVGPVASKKEQVEDLIHV